jgi:homocysteine S-methyltransferase
VAVEDRGTHANASTASHAELDEAVVLDDGDPEEFAAAQHTLMGRLPPLSVLGGCCGIDARHIAALMGTFRPRAGTTRDGVAEA